jgi:hypothetical protein
VPDMSFGFRSTTGRRTVAALVVALGLITTARPAAAAEDIYFSATDNIANVLIQHINAEDERIDMAIWHLTEHSVSIALRNRFLAGVDVRLIGDRAELFELNAIRRAGRRRLRVRELHAVRAGAGIARRKLQR